jgi:esterase
MKLHYRRMGEGSPLFILHGLFGSSDNWQTLGKAFAKEHEVFFVDQRNHGRSPHSEDFNYNLMVDDFLELIDDLAIARANIIGHSMGGKTAIAVAANHPERIDKLVVGDISHVQYPHHHEDVLAGLDSIDLDVIRSRGQADQIMKEHVESFTVRQFLLKNLYWIVKGKKLGWRMNVDVLIDNLDRIIEEIPFDTIETETLFIRGELSNYIPESDFAEIHQKFPNSKIETIKGSGHWVHYEGAKEFYRLVTDFI